MKSKFLFALVTGVETIAKKENIAVSWKKQQKFDAFKPIIEQWQPKHIYIGHESLADFAGHLYTMKQHSFTPAFSLYGGEKFELVNGIIYVVLPGNTKFMLDNHQTNIEIAKLAIEKLSDHSLIVAGLTAAKAFGLQNPKETIYQVYKNHNNYDLIELDTYFLQNSQIVQSGNTLDSIYVS